MLELVRRRREIKYQARLEFFTGKKDAHAAGDVINNVAKKAINY